MHAGDGVNTNCTSMNGSMNGNHPNRASHHDSPEPCEPIAIVGMSCRLPGTATDPSALWDMLVSGRTAWTPGPGRRFNIKGFQDATAKRAGTTNTGGGHFLREDVAAFDASFFGIHPVEAAAMDPQQRMLLEIAYESFENAGITTDAIWGSNTGVYVGQWASDYHEIQTRDIESPPLYLVTGTGPAISSNRISYYFNLRGPSFTVDTGCSSGMVALHQAVKSLRSGETTQCFVGGVNLLLDPQRFTYQSRLQFFSKEGRSFAFDARANGYGRGEGCTGLVLKPLSAALRDGDPVRAVIRNSVLNQDGRTPGISVPSPEAQQEAMLKAYTQAHLDLHADYVEAHGTGTKVGDPIEAAAIAAALTWNRDPESPLPIGSIKGNIGHTESAAGLAGLIKAVLMLEHGIIPPQANFRTVNPAIRLDEWKLRIPNSVEKHNLRKISVNSFGYGGTNAHVVVGSLNDTLSSLSIYQGLVKRINPPSTGDIPRAFVISAASGKACQRACIRLAKYLVHKQRTSAHPDLLSQLAYTLSKRSVHSHRVGLIASTVDELVAQLITTAENSIPSKEQKTEYRVGLVFSGQGAQHANMACELLNSSPTFVSALTRAQKQLVGLGCEWDLLTELRRPKAESRINQPAFSQPLSTAVQLGLVNVLQESGVSPCAVVGHSSGEIAAAYAAKAISLEDAMTAAYFRGRLVGELMSGDLECPGAMLAVGSPPTEINKHIEAVGTEYGRVRIACYNSPSSVTVSGDAAAIDQLKEALDNEQVFNRKLITNGAAYHSHQMDLIKEQYTSCLQNLKAGQPSSSVRMFSTVAGKEIDERSVLNSHYWADNLCSPVKFTQALHLMCLKRYDGLPIDTLVEVGPHSQLGGPVKQTLKTLPGGQERIVYTNTLTRGQDAEISLVKCLTFLNIHNGSVQLNHINKDSDHSQALVDLPPYSFDHNRTYWHESRISKEYRHRHHLPHELLGTLSPDVNRVEPRWRHFLNLKDSSWLQGHVVQGEITYPAAAYIAMTVQAIRQHVSFTNATAKVDNVLLRDVSFGKALALYEDMPQTEISLSLRPQIQNSRQSSSAWYEFRVFTTGAEDPTSTEHCRGLVRAEMNQTEYHHLALTPDDLPSIRSQCSRQTEAFKFYNVAHERLLDWLNPFDCVTRVQTSPQSALVSLRTPLLNEHPGGMGDLLSPAALDSALFHSLFTILFLEKRIQSTCVPTFIRQLRIANRETAPKSDLLSAASGGTKTLDFDVLVQDQKENMVLEAEGVRVTRLPGSLPLHQNTAELCHGFAWVPYMDSWTPQLRHDLCHSAVPAESYAENGRALNALSAHYVQEAARQVSEVNIPEGYLRHYFTWMRDPVNCEIPDKLASAETGNIDLGPLGEAVARLGPVLPKILTGEVAPLSLLTPDNLLSRLYSEGFGGRCYDQMIEYCRQLGRQSSGLRVLEIGAGTASATVPVLQALNGGGHRSVAQYDFTDISPGFFETARERLGDLAEYVEFKVLDIERAGKEQKFKEGDYDLIIACNAIHATTELHRTLSNVRALLKPGGKFMLMEITKDTFYYNLIFGSLSGWWAGYHEGRRLSPLLKVTDWNSRLQAADFRNPEEWFMDFPLDKGGTISVFISSAPSAHSTDKALPPIDLVTIHDNEALTTAVKDSLPTLKKNIPGPAISSHSLSSTTPGGNIVVMLPEVAGHMCHNITPNTWQLFKNWILNAQAVLFVGSTCHGTVDKTVSTLWSGFARTLRLEHPDIRLVTLDVRADTPALVLAQLSDVLPTIIRSSAFDTSIPSNNVENDFAQRDSQLYVARAFHLPEMSNYISRSRQEAKPETVSFLGSDRILTLDSASPNSIKDLRWKDGPEAPSLLPDDVQLELRAAGVSPRDVQIAEGRLESSSGLLNDCSGIVVAVGANMQDRFEPGDRVCALHSRSLTNFPIVHGDCCCEIPGEMTFTDASSVPLAGVTAYYALVHKAELAKGEKVLIHSAADAVGQAAVSIAQHLGAVVFVTVHSGEERELMQDRYGIVPSHTFSTETAAFRNGIKKLTGGYGVDIVLNSLDGEMFRDSSALIAPFGRFIDIGSNSLMDGAFLPMEFLHRNVTLAYVDAALLVQKNKPLTRQLLKAVVELAASRSIQSITPTTVPINDVEKAFGHAQTGKVAGKMVLTVEEGQEVEAIPSAPVQAQLRPDASYVVVGGFGGLGCAIISWLAEHGAKYIIGLSRSGATDQQSRALISDLKTRGVSVVPRACDVSSYEDVASLATEEGRDGFPPVRGIVQCAMVLKDSLFTNMTSEDWQATVAPKIHGSINLCNVLGKDADFFVSLSSIVALSGNVGQCNYAAACSFQDSLARHSTELGIRAYSINVGYVQETGYVSENPEIAATLRRQGMQPIRLSDVLVLLNYGITNAGRSDGVTRGCSLGLMPTDEAVNAGQTLWLKERRFNHLVRHEKAVQKTSSASVDALTLLAAATQQEEAVHIICQAILQRLARLIATSIEMLSPTKSLDSYGVDSLVAVELRNWVGSYLQANISLIALRGASSIQHLAQIVTKESALVSFEAAKNDVA